MKRLAATAVAVGLAAFAGLQAAAASSTTFVVTTTTDALDIRVGDGLCATGAGLCSLRAAIQEANARPGADVIEVPSGTYALAIRPLNENGIATGDLDITDSVAINGAGAASTIVDAGIPLPGAPPEVHGLDRIFEVAVAGGEVSFSGLTLSDGYAAEYGGAIAINSTTAVSVVDSVLTRNVAGKAGGAIDNHLGGSVDVSDSTVTDNFASENGSAINNNRNGSLSVSGSTISSNSAADVGRDESLVGAGAISNNAELDAIGTIAVSGSTMADNSAGGGRPGAAIANDGAGTVTVESTNFSKNVTTGDGGAIANKAGDVTVTASRFAENAAHDGGAIYNDGALEGRVTVGDSEFSLNSASARGGAIEGGGTGTVTVVGGAFAKNRADGLGGAISSSDKASTTIVSSSFTENSGLSGGAFANEGAGGATVEDSTFARNAAFAGIILAAGEGGGMHSNTGGEVAISGGSFTGNHARSGGGLSNEGGGTLTVTGTRFADNRADEQGGGILIQSGAVHMLDIDVVGNVSDSAEEGGGGIAYAGDKLIGVGETAALENSRVRDNKAKGDGGGIDSRGDGLLSITTTTISGNTAAIGGAIHHVGDAPLEVSRSTVSGNFAESGGGMFSDGDGETTVENTTVSTNRAGQFGGGLLVSSRLTLRSSTVASNNAASGGGINNGGGDLVGDGLVFLANAIVANNPTGGNCAGTMTSLGGNIDSGDSCRLRELSDQPGTDPRVGPLANNGGPTQTHALLQGSLAQDRAYCDELVACPPVDQRGVVRPIFLASDVGAYESDVPPEGGTPQPCAGRTERPVTADFDTWVSQSSPAANFGTDAILDVAAGERALVHFALPSAPPGCRLVGATLRLYSSSATEGVTLEALRVTSDWHRLDVTWNSQPATAGPAATTPSGLGFREWDVLAQTVDMYSLGSHGFLIQSSSGDQSFHGTLKGDRPPELVLVFDDPDAPPQAGSCPTTPQLLYADRDSWVSQGSPTNNFGTDSGLKVKSQPGANSRALIRFPVPALPGGCTGIASASLHLDAASAKDGRMLQALQVASQWSEGGVTWSNQPATTGPASAVPSAQGPLAWDVTDQILNVYTSANHGLLIRDAVENGVGDEQTFNSREKIDDGPPQLVLTFDDSTPETTIESGPASPTTDDVAVFAFSSDRADATFECSLDGAAFTACTSPHVARDIAEGDRSFAVRATRRVRAVDPTPATYDWKVAVAPETTIQSGPASPSASSNATLEFSADDRDATFECSLNGAPFAACTSPAEYADLADGPNELRVRAVDPHGNVDPTPAVHGWLVAVPPETTITGGPPDPTGSTSATLSFSADEPATFECALDAAEWHVCSSPIQLTGLGDGEHTLRVRATDAAGNTDPDPATYTWTVDSTAPIATIASAPPALTNDPDAKFELRADEPATFECRLDTGEWTACASPHEYRGLADGAHSFEVRATDPAGNTGEATYVWAVDTRAPTVTITAGPPALTNRTSAAFELTADEHAELECRLDAGDWTACASPHELAGPLADGDHELHVRATDPAANTGDEAMYKWTIDTVAPATTITAAPPALTNRSSASFELSAGEAATFECRLDGGDWTSCTSPPEYIDLADGEHTVAIRATDEAGNIGDAATYGWTIDTVGPATRITDGPPASPLVFEAGEPARFECRLDAGDWMPCASPHEYRDLTDGEHTVEIRATDEAGNTGPAAAHTWTIETRAPIVTITAGPPALTNRTSASLEFTAGEAASFECRLDTGAWTACTSPHSYAELADGDHTVGIRATDAAGNTSDAAAYAWTIDTVAPATTITDGPPASPLVFEAGEPARFECRLDAGDWMPCASPHTYAEPADGRHTAEIRATDEAGNTGQAASWTWTIDTIAPITTITNGPHETTNSTAATFDFTADEPARFECRLDEGEWTACASPQLYADLADGRHTVQVRATDLAGNTGDAAAYSWTVDTDAAATTITAAPPDLTNRKSATFEFTADETAGFECRLDTGAWAPCTSPHELAGPLADGDHTFEVRATDPAGNTGDAATYSWTVDTVAPATTITAGPTDPTVATAASFQFEADDTATFECRLDAGDWTACASPQDYRDLADGDHAFDVRAIDTVGNTSEPASYAWTVETRAPSVTITAGPPALTNATTAGFRFEADETATFECRVDTSDWAPCTSPHEITGPLADGEHELHVRATDPAGNTGAAAVYAWRIDTVAPITTITAGPPASPLVFGADEPARFECRLDRGDWTPCVSPHTYADLADGRHTAEIRATDDAGNTEPTPEVYTWTIDTSAPTTTIRSGPPTVTNSTSATFDFDADERANFECRLDDGDWNPCESPAAYAGLRDGGRSVAIRATDAAGNTEPTPAVYSWTIDTVAPETQIDDRPPATTENTTATFTFSADEPGSTFECSLDGEAFADCTSPREYRDLAAGDHELSVRARDQAGNADGSPASHRWTILVPPPPDTTAPDTTLTDRPPDPASGSAASFAFTGSDDTTPDTQLSFECRLDSQDPAEFVTCSSPSLYAGLGEGAHTFEVRTVDLAGNVDPTPATHRWRIDTTAPHTSITGAPPATTSSTSARFTFDADEPDARFECALDGASPTACTSPRDYSGLAPGAHQFSVRAIDLAGNADATPATHGWTITAPPACGQPVTAFSVADAWVDENSATNNKGSDSILKVQSKGPRDNFRALIRFALPAVPDGCTVQSATLRLYAASAKPARTLHALLLASPWTEHQVSWVSQPLTTGSPAATTSGLGYREWNVTSQVQVMYQGPNHGFVIRDAVEGHDAEQQFHSREKGESPPQLVVRFAAAG